jgi:hypothetical protein
MSDAYRTKAGGSSAQEQLDLTPYLGVLRFTWQTSSRSRVWAIAILEAALLAIAMLFWVAGAPWSLFAFALLLFAGFGVSLVASESRFVHRIEIRDRGIVAYWGHRPLRGIRFFEWCDVGTPRWNRFTDESTLELDLAGGPMVRCTGPDAATVLDWVRKLHGVQSGDALPPHDSSDGRGGWA